MLTNQWIEEEREAARSKVIPCDEEEVNGTVHELVHCDSGHCRMCGISLHNALPKVVLQMVRNEKMHQLFLVPCPKQRWLIRHIEGVRPQRLKQQFALRRWSETT